MENYSKGRSDRGGFGGGRSDRGDRGGFGGSRDRGGFGGRDGGRPELFKATCAECGKVCEVPFRPTGERPVYCSDCFRNVESSSPFGAPRDGGRRDFSPRDRDDRGSRDSRGGRDDRGNRDMLDMGERKMYKATCADCGKECEVPFRPSADRPVFCSDCFITDDNRSKVKKTDDYKQEFEHLNAKLDKILKLLEGKKEAPSTKKESPITKLVDAIMTDEILETAVEEVAAPDVVKKPRKVAPAKEKAEKKVVAKKTK